MNTKYKMGEFGNNCRTKQVRYIAQVLEVQFHLQIFPNCMKKHVIAYYSSHINYLVGFTGSFFPSFFFLSLLGFLAFTETSLLPVAWIENIEIFNFRAEIN